jgi:hypothetical protein
MQHGQVVTVIAVALSVALIVHSNGLYGGGGDAAPGWYTNAEDGTRAYVDYYFSRDVPVRIYGDAVFPFEYTERPTVKLKLGGLELPMLFDTGTYTSILRLGEGDPLPQGMRVVEDSAVPAWLERKNTVDGAVALTYAIAGSVSLGNVYLRDTPFRVYRDGVGDERDYAGAFSPALFHNFIIEVDNDAQLIRLHEPRSFLPPRNSLVLPILILPRGLFVPLVIDGEQLWFHLDTGFSGTLGVLPSVIEKHQDAIIIKDEVSEFEGWRSQHSYRDLLLSITFEPYPYLGWARAEPLEFTVKALAYDDRYQELGDYNVGGIIGSGLLRMFSSYSIDLNQGRLYLAVPVEPTCGSGTYPDAW